MSENLSGNANTHANNETEYMGFCVGGPSDGEKVTKRESHFMVRESLPQEKALENADEKTPQEGITLAAIHDYDFVHFPARERYRQPEFAPMPGDLWGYWKHSSLTAEEAVQKILNGYVPEGKSDDVRNAQYQIANELVAMAHMSPPAEIWPRLVARCIELRKQTAPDYERAYDGEERNNADPRPAPADQETDSTKSRMAE
jgi:hypothetical protein